jgi:hypothetical protein
VTQERQILEALQAGDVLTPADALRRFGCMRLAARVYDLKRDGHAIVEEKVEVPTRSGTAFVSAYSIAGAQGELFHDGKRAFKWEE